MLTVYATICHRNPIQQLSGSSKMAPFGAIFLSIQSALLSHKSRAADETRSSVGGACEATAMWSMGRMTIERPFEQ